MLIRVFGEIINPDNVSFLKEDSNLDGTQVWTYIKFNAATVLGNGCLEIPSVRIINKTKLEVMEEINRQIKESK